MHSSSGVSAEDLRTLGRLRRHLPAGKRRTPLAIPEPDLEFLKARVLGPGGSAANQDGRFGELLASVGGGTCRFVHQGAVRRRGYATRRMALALGRGVMTAVGGFARI